MRRKRGILLILLLCCICMSLNVKNAAAASSVPAAVKITNISSSAYNKITVKWKKVSQATNYIIYYRKNTVKKWTRLASVSAVTSYTHTSSKTYPIVVGQQYDYCVKAYNKKTKKYSTIGSGSIKTGRTLPAAVPLKSAALNSAKTGVVIKWGKVSGASSYLVLRKTSGGWVRIASVDNTHVSYTDKYFDSGARNYYTVRAYNSKAKAYGRYDEKGISVYVEKKSVANKKIKVLFIGNSHTYTNDLPVVVANYAKKNGYTLECVMIAHGGWHLSQHVKEKDVRFNILYGNYDYVILQDHAANFSASGFLRAVQTLGGWIEQTKSKAVLYMPWTLIGEEEKQNSMTSAYKTGASTIGAMLIPVGQKWWDYLSAHPEADLYAEDGHHASYEGTDFAAKQIWKYLYADLRK